MFSVQTPNRNAPFSKRGILFSLLLLMAGGLFSQTTWNGSTSTDWFTAANWSAGVPTAATDATIPGGVPNNPSIAVAGAVARSVTVQAMGSLNIFAAGTLGIDGAVSNAILNQGILQNRGAITIGATTGPSSSGIFNQGTFSNLAGGTINVDGSSVSSGVFSSSGSFTNSGTIIVGALPSSSITARGLSVSGGSTFTNNVGGLVRIDRVGDLGLYVALATFTNAGTITIGSVASVGNNGLQNIGTFNNLASGVVNIDRTVIRGLSNNGVNVTFNNAGAINIGANNPAGDYGLFNDATAFNNLAGGTINIDRSTTYGLQNQSGTFTNAGAITIGAVASNGQFGIHNRSTFNNNAGGLVKIDGSALFGLYNFSSSATFNNRAALIIGSATAVGQYGIFNQQGIFNNLPGSTVQIDRSDLDGLLNSDDGIFTNSATVAIGATGSPGNAGILNNSAVFINNPGGVVQIDRSTNFGIQNLNSPTSFTNAGTITMGALASVGGTAILNNSDAVFNNSACSAVVNIVSNSIVLNFSPFSNAGLIIENASGNSSITSNTGIVQNLNGGTFTITTNTGTLTTCTSPQNACIPIGYGVAPSAACMQAFCIGDSPTVGSLAPNGPGFMWYSSANSTTPLPAGTALVNGGVYFVSQIVAGCETMRARVNVVVTTPAPGKVCIGGCSN